MYNIKQTYKQLIDLEHATASELLEIYETKHEMRWLRKKNSTNRKYVNAVKSINCEKLAKYLRPFCM